MTTATIRLSNDLSELERLSHFLRGLSGSMGMDDQVVFQINLVCDELVTNIILYGYPSEERGRHTIELEVAADAHGWELRLSDRGVPFNPLLRASPRIDLEVEDRGIGGLGIHFVRQVMDDLRYERRHDENVLIMRKVRGSEEGAS